MGRWVLRALWLGPERVTDQQAQAGQAQLFVWAIEAQLPVQAVVALLGEVVLVVRQHVMDRPDPIGKGIFQIGQMASARQVGSGCDSGCF